MKVDKLVANNQPENWFYTVTNECLTYPIMLTRLEQNELIVDIGANVGGFVNAWKYLTNNWLLVEPSVYNCEQIEKNLDGVQFTLVNKAVHSYSNQTLKLQKFWIGNNDTLSGNFGTTGVIKDGGEGWYGDYEEVQTVSYEVLIGTKEVGLLKIDCEGAEYEFLYGKDLSNIKYITGEFHNFLFKDDKGKDLLTWIETTHDEIYSHGGPIDDSHYVKLYKRKDL